MKKLKILAAGDIHGSNAIAEELAKKGEKYKVDLVVLCGDLNDPLRKESIISPFKKRGLEVLFVPGNWDMDLDIKFLEENYSLKNLHLTYHRKGEVEFVGIGNPNLNFRHSKRDFYYLDKLLTKLNKKNTKKVIVSHLHPKKSMAEFSGVEGSDLLRKIIEKHSPDFVFCSHIHEAEGLETKTRKTQVFHVGKKGKIIEI
ncbi:MAG: metallophosphoesterase [Candidatus Pacearchaeota archaeon]